MNKNIYDVIIVGAGPAGIAAGIYTARAKLKTLVLSKDVGGQVAISADIENYPGFIKTTGADLSAKFLEHLKTHEDIIDIVLGEEVSEIEKKNDQFEVTANGNCFTAKSIILTAGKKHRKLNIPGEKEFEGKGVSYCATCDAPLFKNKIVAVVGGGNSALDAALQLANYATKIYLINKNPEFRGEKVLLHRALSNPNIEIINNASSQTIEGAQNVGSLTYLVDEAEKTIEINGVFVAIGFDPATNFLDGLLNLNEWEEVVVDEHCRTNVEGIFAAGDITQVPYKQIAVAVGEGVKAALSCQDYLRKIS